MFKRILAQACKISSCYQHCFLGIVAENIKNVQPNVYVSADGGYTWREALQGAHLYEILDQGALLVAVPKVPNATVIKYSTDEGECWSEFKFTTLDNYQPHGNLPLPCFLCFMIY